jgi:transcription antitermination factor NusG
VTYAVAYLQSRTERQFKEDMESEGIEVWYPVVTRITRPRHKRKAVSTEAPAFGNYAFVKIEPDRVSSVKVHRSVIYLLRFGKEFVFLEDNFIDDLKTLFWEDIHVDGKFRIGDRVVVKAGVMEGYTGSVIRCSDMFTWVAVSGHTASGITPQKLIVKLGLYLLDKVGQHA